MQNDSLNNGLTKGLILRTATAAMCGLGFFLSVASSKAEAEQRGIAVSSLRVEVVNRMPQNRKPTPIVRDHRGKGPRCNVRFVKRNGRYKQVGSCN